MIRKLTNDFLLCGESENFSLTARLKTTEDLNSPEVNMASSKEYLEFKELIKHEKIVRG